MKRILCFGDSNTWGYVPSSDMERYPSNIRYPKVLQSLLGKEYEVIEEGLPGRTIITDDYKDMVGNRNGSLEFGQIVYTALPLDYILIMLGTNDLKCPYNKTAHQCALALEEQYINKIIRKLSGKIKNDPSIIIVAPSILGEEDPKFDENAINESKLFNKEYQAIAEKYHCLFIDNSGLKTGSDGVHLTSDSHLLLAKKIYNTILENKYFNL